MDIVIPSLGRAGTSATMKWIHRAKRPVVLAVHADEVDAYAKAYPDTIIMELSDSCRKHTGLVRREIMNVYKDRHEPFFFVDDDIRISLKAVPNEQSVFDVIQNHILCGASMAGLGQQLFSNAQMDKTEFINGDTFAIRDRFVATVYALDPSDFDACPLEQLPVYEDMALVYHAIMYGGGSITTYVATHSNVSPPTGGCNSWRREDVTIESLKKLVELYPEFCSIRPTTSTTHSQNIGIGLRTAWTKIPKRRL